MGEVESVDVLIVGSGPAGASTALHLLHRDPKWAGRMLVIDKATHPRDKLCGGGITHLGQNVLARLGYDLEPQNVPIKEVRLVYQDLSYSFYGNPVFRIVRRAEFDHWLVGLVEARGGIVRQGEGVRDVAVHDDHVAVVTERATIRARALVAADGSKSFIRQRLKWPGDSHVARLVEVDTPADPRRDFEFRDGVAVFDFTAMTAADLQGYYWDFPSLVGGRPVMNRGVFDSRRHTRPPKADLPGILRTALTARGKKLADYTLKGHPIRWYHRRNPVAQPRVLLAGDAAGADPLFGEGISLALGYGDVAAQALEDAFARQDYSFVTYRQMLMDHWLLWQLPWRTRLARGAYLLRYPWLVRLGWRIARRAIRHTRWASPDFVPTEPPRMRVDRLSAPG